ncbi:MAG: 5-formyltetrahydrofolate cyclo-ligase [Wenzhouxiangella sp.]|nr:MAG: 5-formyltetrahydrofolate cyclo-ligase [Wenzhouxiangella sp.]
MDDLPTMPDLKAELRKRFLQERRSLPDSRRAVLDRQVCAHLLHFFQSQDGSAVAAFRGFRGEPDLRPLLGVLHEAGRRVYLPVVEGEAMRFRRWTPESVLTRNRFGINEPLAGQACPAEELDWVLVPLVAFSPAGSRLGMGGGYYDRAFAFRLRQPLSASPKLVGVAYSLQQVDSLPVHSWDVPLDAVVTDQGLCSFRGRMQGFA